MNHLLFLENGRKLFVTLHFQYLTMRDHGWYECAAFAVDDPAARRHGFRVMVFRGKMYFAICFAYLYVPCVLKLLNILYRLQRLQNYKVHHLSQVRACKWIDHECLFARIYRSRYWCFYVSLFVCVSIFLSLYSKYKVTSKGTAIIILSFFEKMTRKRKNFKKDEKKVEKKVKVNNMRYIRGEAMSVTCAPWSEISFYFCFQHQLRFRLQVSVAHE